jgi:hypothetical protein
MFIDARSSGDKSATQPHESLSGCLKEAGNFMGAMVSTILDLPVMGRLTRRLWRWDSGEEVSKHVQNGQRRSTIACLENDLQ